jgi:hypothetical protein
VEHSSHDTKNDKHFYLHSNFQCTFLSANDLMCRNCRDRTPDMPRLRNESVEPLCQRALSPFWCYNITSKAFVAERLVR